MAKRTNHYDVAFEEYLRNVRTPYVAVDETRRALLSQASLKSMDFIVYSARQRNLLVDVKGRRFPSGGESQNHKWENWATGDDLDSLLQWEDVFGGDFRAVLVFAYDVVNPHWLDQFDACFEFRNRTYAFYGVWLSDYREKQRQRSASWETVCLPSAEFRRLKKPIAEFL
ncbi:MAG: HYExAFE family protein [Planctomycetaceae bacterium]|jgi:hypothetical protein|nr:HYExAFE family protein [Planctomycetaceae bacterium]MBT6157635.1 HYExAFE family protein [Planctomycetaceae bacterium]MBT6483575.1 HYExAFE family protein [Planctomycetaceae bacterium]MBT6495344.1 HYExAFE family protein [Planctomycetaceae bacterium]